MLGRLPIGAHIVPPFGPADLGGDRKKWWPTKDTWEPKPEGSCWHEGCSRSLVALTPQALLPAVKK
jgi:hypothetical protein